MCISTTRDQNLTPPGCLRSRAVANDNKKTLLQEPGALKFGLLFEVRIVHNGDLETEPLLNNYQIENATAAFSRSVLLSLKMDKEEHCKKTL